MAKTTQGVTLGVDFLSERAGHIGRTLLACVEAGLEPVLDL